MSPWPFRPALLGLLALAGGLAFGAQACSEPGAMGSAVGASPRSADGLSRFKGPGYGFSYPDDFRPGSPPGRTSPDFYAEKRYSGGTASFTVSHFRAPGGLDALQDRWATEGMAPGLSVARTTLGGRPALLRQGALFEAQMRESTAVMGENLVQVVVLVPDGISGLNRTDFGRLEGQALKSFTFDPIATQ